MWRDAPRGRHLAFAHGGPSLAMDGCGRRGQRWSTPAPMREYCRYTGKNKGFMLQNTLFRVGGAAVLLSNRAHDRWRAKYRLTNLVPSPLRPPSPLHSRMHAHMHARHSRWVPRGSLSLRLYMSPHACAHAMDVEKSKGSKERGGSACANTAVCGCAAVQMPESTSSALALRRVV